MINKIKIIPILFLFMTYFSEVGFSQNTKSNKQHIKNKIIRTLKTIEDPELKINIYDLGLIREINISPDNNVSIRVIFTKLFCPYGKKMVDSIKKKVNALPEVKSCKVTVDINTRWKRSMLTEEGTKKMKNIYSW